MDAAELRSEKYSDYEFALDVNMFHYHYHYHYHQDKDKEILKQIQHEIKRNPHSTFYITKEVEGVDSVHRNNKILVPKILQERVTNWYHSILVNPRCDRMEDNIRSLYTWKGL